MIRVDEINVEIARIARFGVVGVSSALLYFVVTIALAAVGVQALVATVVGQAIAAAASYFGHREFSFAVKNGHENHIFRFLFVTAVTFFLNLGITSLLLNFMGLSAFISIAVITVVIPVVSYLLNRFWVFVPKVL